MTKKKNEMIYTSIEELTENSLLKSYFKENKELIKKISLKTSVHRFNILINILNSKGYYGFDRDLLKSKMDNTLEDNEIIQDMIQNYFQI